MQSANGTRRWVRIIQTIGQLECRVLGLTKLFSFDVQLQQLLDYDSARTKARKLIDKPSDDSGKLPLAEKQAEDAREGGSLYSPDLGHLIEAQLTDYLYLPQSSKF